jgi:hypothetical protein
MNGWMEGWMDYEWIMMADVVMMLIIAMMTKG